MNSATDRSDVPDVVLERYRLGELPPADAERLERGLQGDPALRLRLEMLEASDAEMERTGVPDRLAAGVRVRVARLRAEHRVQARPSLARWLVPAAVAVAATVVVVSLPGARARLGLVSPPWSNRAGGSDRVKGVKPSLTLYRKTAVGTEKLDDGAVLRAGDLVRVAYQGAGRAYGVIVSIDGRGGVTLHLPASGPVSARLLPGDRVLLDRAYELDDAPRFEKFYLITGDVPFDVGPIVEAASRAAAASGPAGPPPLAVGPGLDQASASFIKEGKS
jgi:hypothetical protein